MSRLIQEQHYHWAKSMTVKLLASWGYDGKTLLSEPNKGFFPTIDFKSEIPYRLCRMSTNLRQWKYRRKRHCILPAGLKIVGDLLSSFLVPTGLVELSEELTDRHVQGFDRWDYLY